MSQALDSISEGSDESSVSDQTSKKESSVSGKLSKKKMQFKDQKITDRTGTFNFEADPEYQLHYDSIVKLDTPVILGSGMQHKTSKMKQGLPPPQPDERYEGGRSSGNWTEK